MNELEVSSTLVWLRPWWLLALIPQAYLLYRFVKWHRDTSDWDSVVDTALAPFVLESTQTGVRRWPIGLLGVFWLLAVLILAGPSWHREELPVFIGDESEVLILDLSRSMDVEDQKPNRLALARFKIDDLLDRARGRQVGLVVFSEVPYVVSPLTDDVATLRAFLPALETSVVPVQGSQLALAIEKAHQLLKQADLTQGSLIMLTDGRADASALQAASRASADGFTLSVIGVGTEQGQPMKDPDGGLVQDASGKIVLPRLERSTLIQLAKAGGGIYSDLQSDDSDIELISDNLSTSAAFDREDESRQSVNWIEYGPMMLPLLLLGLLLAFRRGVLT